MNKALKIFLVCIFVVSAIYIYGKSLINESKSEKIITMDENLKSELIFKGLKGAVDFDFDENGNCYIAFKNKIQIINYNGKSFELLKNDGKNINSLCYKNNKLYYSSGTKVFCFDIASEKNTEIINDLPNYGDYSESIVRTCGDYLYITLGAATNSGVVGQDNKWITEFPYFHDVTPKSITLKGVNYGLEKTGAFQNYKTLSVKGQIISAHSPGNATIIIYNISTTQRETFAWGIRNIKGMDFNSQGKLIASVGGMENRGARPVNGDSDYLYDIKKNTWYGWPDYSGGDPMNSPRFKGENNSEVKLILENHPSTNPPAPIYQSKAMSKLGAVAIDSKGVLSEANNIYFCEISNNTIYSLDSKGIKKEKFILASDIIQCKLKFQGNKLYILDGINGNLFSAEKLQQTQKLIFNEEVSLYFFITIIIGIILILKVQK